MSNCSFCGQSLNELDMRAGRCSECGMVIGADSDVNAATIWSGSFDQNMSPSMSLKGDSSTSQSAAQSNLVVKERVFGNAETPDLTGSDYHLEEVLGKGGMGVVYSARQTSIDRRVAVKMLQPRLASDQDQVQKFLAEAVVTGDLDHPNIVPIYDLGVNEEGHTFYSMKRVGGTRWKDEIRTKSLPENLEILMKVSDAIALAHSRGVIHRDLKPENIMLGEYGEVLVMDWGLAITTDSFQKVGGIRQSASKESTPVGTPIYMAPEMASGRIDRICIQSDIYLLGAILFEIVTGMAPHPGRSAMKCLLAALRNEIVETPHTGELMDVARRAMATNPEDRYETVHAFQAAIRECQSHSESIMLADKAERNLQQARDSVAREEDGYELFQQALFGFKEAYELWNGNSRALSGASKARLEYAESALARGDLDLAASVLDLNDPVHAEVQRRIDEARTERDQRQQRLKTARRVMLGLTATVLVVVTGAFFQVNAARGRAVAAADEAERQRVIAEDERGKAVEQEKLAVAAAEEARTQRDIAEAERLKTEEQRKIAETQRMKAVEQEKVAVAAAKEAREQEQKAIAAAKKAEEERLKAVAAKEAEEKEREKAELAAAAEKKAKDAAVLAQAKAVEEQKKAVAAKEAEEKERKKAELAQAKAVEEQKKAVAAKEAEEKERKKAEALAVAEKKAKEEAVEAQKKALAAATAEKKAKEAAVLAQAKAVEEEKKAVAAAKKALAAQEAEEKERKKAEALAVAEKKAKEEAVAAQKKALAAAEAEKKAKEAAVLAQAKAVEEQKKAVAAKEAEEKERKKAEALAIAEKKAKEEAEEAQKKAVAAAEAEKKAKEAAVAAAEAEKKAREAAVAAAAAEKKAKEAAVAAREAEEYEAYVAQIGLAAARIEENAFESAVELLSRCKPELRNWEWGRLMHLCSQSDETWTATAPLNSIDMTADGARFVSAGWNGLAEIHDTATGELIHSLKHSGELVHSVSFSPDGQLVATGSNSPDGFLQLWDAVTGKRLAVQFQAEQDDPTYGRSHQDAVLSVSFSPDGRRLATSSYDKTARIWEVASGRQLSVHHGHLGWVWSASFSKNGERLVTSGQDGTVVVWNLATGEQSAPFTEHDGPVYSAKFSPDGESIVSAGYDRRLLRWNPNDLKRPKLADLIGGSKAGAVQFEEFTGHTAAVRAVSFSEDGSLVLSSGHDNTIRIWNAETAEAIRTFRGHDSWVRSCVFADDGRSVLSASYDSSVRKWSIAGYEEIRVLQGRVLDGHAGQPVMSASFSADGSRIVTSSRDRSARSWNTSTGKPEQQFVEGHQYLTSSATFFSDGRKIITAASDGTARVWDVATGAELARLDGSGMSSAIALSGDERFLLTGGDERDARLWQLTEAADGMKIDLVRQFRGHGSEVTAVAFSPDDKVIYTGDARGYGRLWNRETGEEIRRLEGHTRKIIRAVFLPDGQHLLTASGDNTVARWEVATGRELTAQVLKHPDKIISFAMNGDGTRGVTSCEDGQVRVWDLTAAKVLRTLNTSQQLVNSVGMTADGSRIITADPDVDSVLMWNAETGEQIAGGEASSEKPWLNLREKEGQVWAASFSPDGSSVLTVGGDDARLWDTSSGTQQMSFRQHSAVAAASFSPDGDLLITGSWDSSAKIWNAETGRTIRRLEGAHHGNVNSAVFSPDGQLVLTGSDDGTAVLWNPTTGEVVRTLSGHAGRVHDAAFSQDGSLIVTASSDGTVGVWNTATGEEIKRLKGHDRAVLCARFSEDGTRLITGSDDGTARTWNLETGRTEMVLEGHTASVTTVAFSPGGRRALTGSRDNTVKLWDSFPQTVARAEAIEQVAEDGEPAADGKIPSAREILTLTGHNREITSVAFSPDGRYALTAADDGRAILWLTVDWKSEEEARQPVAAVRPPARTGLQAIAAGRQ